MKKILPLIFLFLASCSNSYKEHYSWAPKYNRNATNFYRGEPTIINAEDIDVEAAGYYKKGYILVGESNFNSGNVKSAESKLKAVAKDVGAEVVLWNKVYTNTIYNGPITRTPQENATNVPYSSRRYNYATLFLSKSKK